MRQFLGLGRVSLIIQNELISLVCFGSLNAGFYDRDGQIDLHLHLHVYVYLISCLLL